MIEKILKKNIEITNLSNYKTKAFTKFYYELNSLNDLENLSSIYKFSKSNNLWFLIIWGGTNMLFAFDIYDWVIIKNNLRWWNYNKETKILSSYTNELITDIAKWLEYELWQKLWHRFIWLPWSIWGAIFWNAWCFWLEIENNFLSCQVYELHTWQIKILWKNDMDFSYRNSIIKKNKDLFIISSEFDLSYLSEKYSSDVDNLDFRENKQPKWNSCWSFFKNPSREQSAWFLIESVWLKGFKLWTAYFSDLHSNFLMSEWNGSYNDLLSLISIAKEKVYNKFNLHLEPEVRIIYNNNK